MSKSSGMKKISGRWSKSPRSQASQYFPVYSQSDSPFSKMSRIGSPFFGPRYTNQPFFQSEGCFSERRVCR